LTSYILDASVAAKWVLPSKDEPLAAEALRLLELYTAGDVGLSAPDLFWPEIGNILWKSVRLGRISENSATEAIRWLRALGIPSSSTLPLTGDAFEIALSTHRSVYDSVYVAMAIASSRLFVTADERLVNSLGARFPIRWLGSITLFS